LHEALVPVLGWGYSSTRKTRERMGAKGFIACESHGNKNSYTALLDKMPTLAAYVQDFATRVFEINGPLPVAMFANSKLVSADEIADLEKLLVDLARQESTPTNKKDA